MYSLKKRLEAKRIIRELLHYNMDNEKLSDEDKESIVSAVVGCGLVTRISSFLIGTELSARALDSTLGGFVIFEDQPGAFAGVDRIVHILDKNLKKVFSAKCPGRYILNKECKKIFAPSWQLFPKVYTFEESVVANYL